MNDELPAQTRIWRYMTFWKFAAMIQGDFNTLWFTRPFKFDDKWEGVCPPAYFSNMHRFGSADGVEYLRRMEASRKYGYFVNCWHMNNHESDAMWKLYGLAPDGIAIQTTIGLARSRIMGLHRCDPVEYYDPDEQPIMVNHNPELILLKRHDFKWEQEVRFWDIDFPINERIKNGETITEADVDSGKELQITDLGEFIQRIVIAPGASPAFEKTVKDLCRATNKNWLAERVQRSAGDRTRDSYLT